MSVQVRMRIEKQIVDATCKAFFDAGYALTWSDGEGGDDRVFLNGKQRSKLVKIITNYDDGFLVVLTQEEAKKKPEDGKRAGWVRFVFGNSGWDAISDYTMNFEELLKPVQALSDKLEKKFGDQ